MLHIFTCSDQCKRRENGECVGLCRFIALSSKYSNGLLDNSLMNHPAVRPRLIDMILSGAESAVILSQCCGWEDCWERCKWHLRRFKSDVILEVLQ